MRLYYTGLIVTSNSLLDNFTSFYWYLNSSVLLSLVFFTTINIQKCPTKVNGHLRWDSGFEHRLVEHPLLTAHYCTIGAFACAVAIIAVDVTAVELQFTVSCNVGDGCVDKTGVVVRVCIVSVVVVAGDGTPEGQKRGVAVVSALSILHGFLCTTFIHHPWVHTAALQCSRHFQQTNQASVLLCLAFSYYILYACRFMDTGCWIRDACVWMYGCLYNISLVLQLFKRCLKDKNPYSTSPALSQRRTPELKK